MSGSEAVLVLQKARELAGDPKFRGSRAEALRLASVALDADHWDACVLLQLVCPPERMMERLENQVPRVSYSFRRRMLDDFDSAIGKLYDVVESRRKRVGIAAANDAFNWTDGNEATKNAKWLDNFPAAVEEAKKIIK
jgi:hypothetical protein